ncbi:hypothetical protein HKBW3S44_01943, partial [Candidatus Hakubella thermalkaliphila]
VGWGTGELGYLTLRKLLMITVV